MEDLLSKSDWLDEMDALFAETAVSGGFPPTPSSGGEHRLGREWATFVDFVMELSTAYLASPPEDAEKIRSLIRQRQMLCTLLVSIIQEQKWLLKSREDYDLLRKLLGIVSIHDGLDAQYIDSETASVLGMALELGIKVERLLEEVMDSSSEATAQNLAEIYRSVTA